MSRKYKNKYVVVWLSYIDSSKSRNQGRKISMKDAVKNPKLSEVIEAARQLNIFVGTEEKQFPKTWWHDTVRVIVIKTDRKIKLLKRITSKIKELRTKKYERH